MLQELVIKVPAPFAGRADVGFSARYPAQPAQAKLKDVPFSLRALRARCAGCNHGWSSSGRNAP